MTEFGPIRTLSPILTSSLSLLGIIVTKSYTTLLLPIFTSLISPLSVDPYHIDDFSPNLTLPITTLFGATKSAPYNSGILFFNGLHLNEGINLSSEVISP